MSQARIGTVQSIDDTTATVRVRGGQVLARPTDQVASAVTLGVSVLLLPIAPGPATTWLIVGTVPVVPEHDRTEFVPNGGFDEGIPDRVPDGWTDDGTGVATWTLDPARSHTYPGALGVGLAADTDPVTQDVRTVDPIQVDDDAEYSFTAWASSETAATVHALLVTASSPDQAVIGGSGAQVLTSQLSTVLTAAWASLGGQVTIPTGHTWARVVLRTQIPAATSAWTWWDDVSLTRR